MEFPGLASWGRGGPAGGEGLRAGGRRAEIPLTANTKGNADRHDRAGNRHRGSSVVL